MYSWSCMSYVNSLQLLPEGNKVMGKQGRFDLYSNLIFIQIRNYS